MNNFNVKLIIATNNSVVQKRHFKRKEFISDKWIISTKYNLQKSITVI